MNAQNEKENIKEPFCPVCVAAVPLAFSMTAGAASTAIEEKKKKKSNYIMVNDYRNSISHLNNLFSMRCPM